MASSHSLCSGMGGREGPAADPERLAFFPSKSEFPNRVLSFRGRFHWGFMK